MIICNIAIFASFGASITVVSQTTSEAFSKILYNQLCFLRYQDNQVSPDDWNVRPAADYVNDEWSRPNSI